MTIPSEKIIRQVRNEFGPRTMLAFSMGKDSIAAYIAMRDHFEEIIPYHLFLIPDLEFELESIEYYERVLGRKIWRMPHPGLYKWFKRFVFQPPHQAAVLLGANLPAFDYNDVVNWLAEYEHLEPEKIMVANGVRAADSPMRYLQFKRHGAVSLSTRRYSPIWDWNKERLIEAISKSGIRLPVDYEMFGRSFDGIDARFLVPLKKHRPRDYAKVLEWFPLAEIEVWRYEKT